MSNKRRAVRIDRLYYLGILLTVVLAVTVATAVASVPLGLGAAGGAVVGALFAGFGAQVAGALLFRKHQPEVARIVGLVGSLLGLPAGFISAVGVWRTYHANVVAMTLSSAAEKEVVPRRPRELTQAMVVFALGGLGALLYTVISLTNRDFVDWRTALEVVAVANGGILSVVVADMLWRQADGAIRAGFVVALVFLLNFAVYAFIWHSYLAVGLIGIPVLLLLLLFQGRPRKSDGLSRPGSENRDKQRRARGELTSA